jgi:hypothetical protein
VNLSQAGCARLKEKVGHVDSEKSAKEIIQPSRESYQEVVEVQFGG